MRREPPAKSAFFYPSRTSVIEAEVSGRRIAASHDFGTAAPEMRHFVDHDFLMSLPHGNALLQSVVPAHPPCSEMAGTKNDRPEAVLGMLPEPLVVYCKANSSEYAVRLELTNALVINKLPVPLHISVKALTEDSMPQATKDAARASTRFASNASKRLEAEEFDVTYRQHPFWVRTNQHVIGLPLGGMGVYNAMRDELVEAQKVNFRGAQARAMARQLLRSAQSETESTAQRHAHLVTALHVLTNLPAVAQRGGEQLARDVVVELTLTSAGDAEATNASLASLEEAAGTPGLTQGIAQPMRDGLRDLRARARAHAAEAAAAEAAALGRAAAAEQAAREAAQAAEVSEAARRTEEPRRCKSCGESKPKSAFTDNQWRKARDKRRCIPCQEGGVLGSVEAREQQAAWQAEMDDFTAIRAAKVAEERRRVEAELARRNELEHADTECCVCFEEANESEGRPRCSFPCHKEHWLCAPCMKDHILASQNRMDAHTNQPAPAAVQCVKCRAQVPDEDLPALMGLV